MGLLKLETPFTVWRLHDHVGTEDVRWHEVGGELDAIKVEAQGFGKRSNQHRFSETWNTFQQAVASNEHAVRTP